MAFDPAFLDELRARLPLSSVIGRKTKLVRSGRNWKACCPFHGEKTPSFYVYDDHFHCFGCGAHGDVISFVMQSEGRSFPETVEQLAGEAGLDVPRQDPRAEARAREAKSLGDVLEAVQTVWRRKLREPDGKPGLDYLRRRGLTEETIETFGLGWSGDGRGGLAGEMLRQEITPQMLAQAGLMRLDESGAPRGELFFNRVTFPIRDRRGRLVSFGARTLGDGQPKYLNGPETALFSKRRTLFNLDRARLALREDGQTLLVVEGYMDVIALHQAGFRAAVAPLGTALGVEQLELLWQAAPAPVICLDGDAAGARAALRAAETALPLLSPERTLRFCRLDAKDDPDSLIRREGPEAMRRVLGGATSLADELFFVLSAGVSGEGPEQRAALRAKLEASAALIGDRSLASEYRRSLLDRYFAMARGGKRLAGSPSPARSVPARMSVAAAPPSGARERLNAMTAILLVYPSCLPDVEQAWAAVALPEPLDTLREAMFDWLGEQGGRRDLDAESLHAWLVERGVGAQRQAVLEGRLPRLPRIGEGDALLEAGPLERWWEFYSLANREEFQRLVAEDLRLMFADTSLERAPEAVIARLKVHARLQRGESMAEEE
ncbi:DNA primase [Acidomonas methanolica]|uniref:DNA primase n=1 Tax=Acidomonas methanolica TaxID=437 RepID=UPI00211A9378|nr:DNA primase [Acidomonas methanolica]MCQ9154712.1 DNA primase [Acidomonas methanolica]